jgi:hypothetical protein
MVKTMNHGSRQGYEICEGLSQRLNQVEATPAGRSMRLISAS